MKNSYGGFFILFSLSTIHYQLSTISNISPKTDPVPKAIGGYFRGPRSCVVLWAE
jgi:hypothetical protein